MSIMPEFVTPDYFYINLSVNVKYQSTKTALTASNIQNLVISEVQNYFSTYLQKFDNDFVFSKLSKSIDDIGDYIVGNLMTVKLQKRIKPTTNSLLNIYLNDDAIMFKNGIVPASVSSTNFIIFKNNGPLLVSIRDIPDDSMPNNKGKGTLRIIDAQTNALVEDSYGTVDYGTGEITINNLNFIGYPEDVKDIRITATVQDEYLDVTVSRNQIILLDDSTLSVASNRFSGLTVNVIAVWAE